MPDWWFEEHPNPHSMRDRGVPWWGYRTSNAAKRVVVVHEAVIRPDLDGQDSTAENVARYASNVADRRVSWHDTTDTDSAIHMCPADALCAHVGNFNTPSVGVEQGFDGTFETLSDFERFLYLFTCGLTVAWRLQQIGSPPVHITAGEAFAGGRGWTTHRELQPDIRQDPEWSDATVAGFGRLVRLFHGGGRIAGRGDVGPHVVAAQRALAAAGFDVGPVDGQAGPRFDDAVRAWERANTKPQTGLWAPWAHQLDHTGQTATQPQEQPVTVLMTVEGQDCTRPGVATFSGWVVSTDGRQPTVRAVVDDQWVPAARAPVTHTPRGDVVAAHPGAHPDAGFAITVPADPGSRRIRLVAYVDGQPAATWWAPVTVIAAPGQATIDTEAVLDEHAKAAAAIAAASRLLGR